MPTVLLASRLLLAAVFLLAGATKLADPRGWRKALRDFSLPGIFTKPAMVLLPLVEIAAGLAIFSRWCSAISTIMLAQAFAQTPSGPHDDASCRHFVQQFYDWYVPLIETTNGRTWDLALRRKPTLFNPELVRALKADSAAQARAKGELVGIDFHPFVGSQDPADDYEARRVSWRGNRCSVEVCRASPRDTAARLGKPGYR